MENSVIKSAELTNDQRLRGCKWIKRLKLAIKRSQYRGTTSERKKQSIRCKAEKIKGHHHEQK